MTCKSINVDGAGVIVCGNFGKPAACMNCGKPSSRLCDWKTERLKTCDAALCGDCTHEPAPDKDLCPRHADAWQEHLEAIERRRRA